MTTSPRGRTAIISGSALTVVAALLSGCGPTSQGEATSSPAKQSAHELQDELTRLADSGVDVDVSDLQTLAVLYGEDGGVTCINVTSPFMTVFNAGHFGSASGRRAGIVDPAAVAYDEAVIQIYCPESLADYRAATGGWPTARTLPGW